MDYLTKQKYSFVSRAPGVPKETFGVIRFSGFEAVSGPYEFQITVVSENPDTDPLSILRNPAVFTIHREEREDVDFNGILFEFQETGEFNGYYFFKAVLAPKLKWLSLTHHNQVFLDSTVPEIMEAALKDAGLYPGIDFEFRLQKEYDSFEYICQYDESHFNFVSRWAEREGIYYFFEQTSTGEKVVFTDTRISHTDLLYEKNLTYHPPSGLETLHGKEVIHSFICRHNLLPQRVYLKDYNYMKPSMAMEAVADVDENGRGENYIYGLNFDTPEEGKRLARIRAEALICGKSLFNGESSVPFMVPGFTFDLKDHYKSGYNRKYLITEVTHEGHQTGYLTTGLNEAVSSSEEEMFYANSFTAIYSDVQFRPDRKAVNPKISGTINAKIDAASSGKYAELDSHGRYKVILPFDRSGRFGGKASAWFRMMQPYAGQNQGMHFPLHKGTEVMLTFIDGDPDRPVIAGAVPNPATASPVTNANPTRSSIKTGRSPEDRSVGAAEYARDHSDNTNSPNNYIEFEDKQNSEYIKTHSPNKIETFAGGRYKRRELGPSEESGHDKYKDDGSAAISTFKADSETDELIDTLKAFAPGNVLGYDEATELDPSNDAPPQGFPEEYIVAPTPSVPETFKSFIENTPPLWCYTTGGPNDYAYHKLSDLYENVEQAWEEYWKYWVAREHSNAKGYENPEYINHTPDIQLSSPWFIAINWDVHDGLFDSSDEWLEDYRSESNWDFHCRTEWDKWVAQKIEDFKEWQPHLLRGHIRVSHRDTFNIQEGNIYDFGGYWNYNLGNCYVEEHLDQSATLNDTYDKDLPDKGGPHWTKMDWSKARDTDADECPSEDEIKIGPDEDPDKLWNDSNGGTNVWVEKTFGNAYTYTQGNSIEVTKGDSLEIQHGGDHVEMVFRGDGTIKSWSRSGGGVSDEKKWSAGGDLLSKEHTATGITTTHKYCRDSGAKLSYNSTHQGANSVHSFDFNWANTASAEFTFASSSSFSCTLALETSMDVRAAASFSLEMSASMDISFALLAAGKIDISASAGPLLEIANSAIHIKLPGYEAQTPEPVKNELEAVTIKNTITGLKSSSCRVRSGGAHIASPLLNLFG